MLIWQLWQFRRFWQFFVVDSQQSAFMQIRSVVLLISVFFCSFAIAQDPKTSEQLGRVNFPTSCTAEAQPVFEKGVALLHSFQYATADAAFADAAQKDPHCAIAYWGEAMSLYH